MTSILSTISLCFIPGMITIVIIHGMLNKVAVYDSFIEGAKSGIRTAVEILPFIIAIFIGIEAMVSSGAMDYLEDFLGPILERIGIPRELSTLILLRPVSGSGSLALVERMVTVYGADSFIGNAASVMAGSCETVFYVIAIYFGATSVKKIRHSLSAGLIGYGVGVLASVWIIRLPIWG
ncbi:MAG TPA: nucleoside recognition domain-containing protein [Anaerovoracaceae bacterium]|nr:nucleoside recognition domain-containing protein [Anaerovoracaceae bacterium]